MLLVSSVGILIMALIYVYRQYLIYTSNNNHHILTLHLQQQLLNVQCMLDVLLVNCMNISDKCLSGDIWARR